MIILMNILNKVTLKSLQKNRTRTIVTIIGIILSAAMITAVTTIISSLQNFMLQSDIYTKGNWYGAAISVKYDTIEELEKKEQVTNVVYSENIGYVKLENSQNDYKPYLFILGANADFFKDMPVHILEGRLPENSSEIILPDHLKSNAEIVGLNIGDTYTYDVGYRKNDVGQTLWQEKSLQVKENNEDEPYDRNAKPVAAEEIVLTGQKTYKVVGFYERPDFEGRNAPGYTAITIGDKTGTVFNTYFRIDKPKETYDFIEETFNPETTLTKTNDRVLLDLGAKNNEAFYAVIYSLGAIFIALIVFGSISLIYNAFSISVSERTKQFGLLASIGATKKQLRRSVVFEALFVSAIGIPIGILCGIAGIGVTLFFVGETFAIMFMSPIGMTLSVSIPSIIIAAVIALVTVLISVYIPAKRATKVSAIEAIRQTADINVKAKEVKTSKLTYKLFGLEGVIAKKHYKRNKRKYRATVISLFMSIVLFISASSFGTYLKKSATEGFEEIDGDIGYNFSANSTKDEDAIKLFNVLSGSDEVTNISMFLNYQVETRIEEKYLSQDYKDNMRLEDGYALVNTQLLIVEDSSYKQFLKDNKLDEAKYMNSEEPIAVVMDYVTLYNQTSGKYSNFHVLNKSNSEIQYRENEYDDEGELIETEFTSLRIGQTTDTSIFGTNMARSQNLNVMISQSMADKMFSDNESTLGGIITMKVKNKDFAAAENNIKKTLEDNGLPTSGIENYMEYTQYTRQLLTLIGVFTYGFIILISLISMANIFNTISTNISLRRREFAMLKTVGMTKRGFNKMMNFECLLYGIKSLIYGIPVSIVITYLIYRSIEQGWGMSFIFPWLPIGIAVFSVFAVVFATMLYSMSKIKKENPIDALKNENL